MSDLQANDRDNVRVRFAPSPTGYLHVGGARTALFNWLFARKTGGKFILRIEDTDQQRSSDEMVRGILEGLEWLGLWEDPKKDSFYEGPFYQSDYADKHRAAAYQLLESGAAYRDFTPKQERDDANIKQEIAKEKVVNPYRDLSKEESDARAAAGEPFVIRFKVPEEGKTQFDDAVFGLQERDYKDTEDLVLLRSDGHPLYNLSVTVDDINMGITHVVRGQDHLSNTHKQVLIYEALGAKVPKFAHLPLILAPNKGKLSKRKHGEIVSVTTYRDRGFLPDAFANFLALLGWAPPDNSNVTASLGVGQANYPNNLEVMSRKELINIFKLKDIHKSNAVFNFSEGDDRNWTDPKALWMNAEYIKLWGRFNPLCSKKEPQPQLGPLLQKIVSGGAQIKSGYWEKFYPLLKRELVGAGLWRESYEGAEAQQFGLIIHLLSERARTLKDFTSQGRAYFIDGLDFEFDDAAVKKNLQKEPALKELLPGLADALGAVAEFTHDSVEAGLRAFSESKGVKPGLLINATRTALTGQAVGPSLFELVVAIGKTRTVERLKHAASLV